jgi:transposase
VVAPPSDDASKDELRAMVMKLIAVTEEQARRIDELEARLRKDSGNSSKPPSSDAPWSKRRRQRRPASGRKQGGQPGHEGAGRAPFAAEELHAVVDHRPAACPSCGGEIEPLEGAPVRHQVTELPPLAAETTEHRLHRGRCRRCGEETLAALPAGVPRGAFGPRLQAMTAALSGVYRLSRREVPRLLADAFGVKMGLGSVTNAESRICAALASAHAQAIDAVRRLPVLNVDETPWRLKGTMPWLWTATSEEVTAYRVDERRSFEALKRLIGEDYAGKVVADRMGAYDKLPIAQRQLCWSHLDRDFKALAEGAPGERPFGRRAVRASRSILRTWRRFQVHDDRPRLLRELAPRWEELIDLLVEGSDHEEKRVRALSRHLLDRAEALSTFADHEGVDPTNNAAERSLRKAVLWRKGSFGSQSERGCRFVERVLTVATTLRQQGRNVFDYLVDVANSPLTGVPPPALVPVRASSRGGRPT